MATGSSAFKVLQCHPCKKACDITSRVLIAGEHTSIEKVAGDLYHGFGVSSSANPLDLAVKVIAKSNTILTLHLQNQVSPPYSKQIRAVT